MNYNFIYESSDTELDYLNEEAILEGRIAIFHPVSKNDIPEDFKQLALRFNQEIEKKKLAKMKKNASLVITGNRYKIEKDLEKQAINLKNTLEKVFIACGFKASKNSVEIDSMQEHGNIFFQESKDKKYIYVGYYELPFQLRDNGTPNSIRHAAHLTSNLGKFVFKVGFKKLRGKPVFQSPTEKAKNTINRTAKIVNKFATFGNVSADVASASTILVGVVAGIQGFRMVVKAAKTIDGILFVKPVFYLECIENSEFNRKLLGLSGSSDNEAREGRVNIAR